MAQSAVKQFARQRNLEVYQPATLKDPASLSRILGARPQAIVVAAYGLLLPQAILDCAPLGCLNVHASLLPRWRGAAPIQRAILAGDRETGITIMKMDAGLDSGPMLAQRSIPITEEDDAGTLHDQLARLGAEMVVSALAAVATGVATLTPQPATGVTHAKKIDKLESVLDWSRPALELARAVRAFRPTPGAASVLGGAPVKIWAATVAQGAGAPGEIISADRSGIVVACGQGALAITELQRAGGTRLSAADFLRGQPLASGARFGESGQRA